MNKYHNWINTGLIAVVLILVLIGGNQSGNFGATGTRFPNGISADTTSPVSGEVRGSTLTITGAQTLTGATSLNGLVTLNAGYNNSYVNSTSTADTTQQLVAADIIGYTSVVMTPTVGATTVTFPASSTLAAMVPAAGDWFVQCWYNATTTASQTITFAAGTGIDLQRNATTTTVGGDTTAYPIDANGYACLKYFRQPATATTFDIGVLITGYLNAD